MNYIGTIRQASDPPPPPVGDDVDLQQRGGEEVL